MNMQPFVSLGVTAITLALIGVVAASRIASPMRRLATAADALGRGQSVDPLPETGPDDIRRTAEAFNRMQARLSRFVEDRTRMLAAISHDLRTPLTSLRLRAEFVTDADAKQRMLSTIKEIQTMTEAALAFAREESITESTRMVDVTALVESLCEDLADLGGNVAFLDSPRLPYRCRPDGLLRATRNLIENAMSYGNEARVQVIETPATIEIIIKDSGPGIPDGDLEKVFAPYEFLGATVAVGLVVLCIAVSGKLVQAGDDIDAHPTATEMIECGSGRGEIRRSPITRANGDQRLECRGSRAERRRNRKRVRTAPAGADQSADPAVVLQGLGMACQRFKAVVIRDGCIAAMARFGVVGNIPEKFRGFGHRLHTQFPLFCRSATYLGHLQHRDKRKRWYGQILSFIVYIATDLQK